MFDDIKIKHFRTLILTITILGAMFTTGLLLSSGLVVGQMTPDPVVDAQPQVYIRSRFILWDSYEKMIDKNFDIILISWSNNTSNYSIQINTEYFNGSFYQYILLNYSYNISTILSLLEIKINNNTVLHATDISIVSGISQAGINTISEPYKISFLPFELTRLEWNLVFSGVIAVFIALPVSYITIKYYRKHRGAQVL